MVGTGRNHRKQGLATEDVVNPQIAVRENEDKHISNAVSEYTHDAKSLGIEQQRLDLQVNIGKKLFWLFAGSNFFILVCIAAGLYLDFFFLENAKITSADRIVNTQVFLALIGAITVQVGAGAYVFAKWLFPVAGDEDSPNRN